MNQRGVVQQRILTLDGLLAKPDGPFGPAAGDLAAKLAEGWRSERRLLRRILDETQGDDVRSTLHVWHERTAAFAEKSEDQDPQWRDREGHVWHARAVLRMLDDFRRRLDAWIEEESGGAAANRTRASGTAIDTDPAARREAAALAEQARREAMAEGLHDELDDVLEEQAEDGAHFESVLGREGQGEGEGE